MLGIWGWWKFWLLGGCGDLVVKKVVRGLGLLGCVVCCVGLCECIKVNGFVCGCGFVCVLVSYLVLTSVAGLDLQLGGNSLGFTVDAGHEGDVTFQYSGLIDAAVLSDYKLVVQKFNTTTNQWESIHGDANSSLISLHYLWLRWMTC
ncbi:hypothetical protein [Acinetobacter baumannii]|uniref:hypothetical protein n=1 Tax=Acinetobacter baumannii TaxID=470 RepID=UPI00333B5225